MKIGVIGMGWVGTSVAMSVLHSGTASELLLNDIRPELAEGEAMDMAHGAPFYPSAKVRTATVEEMCDADAVVVAAGRGGSPGETRLDLLASNAAITRKLGEQLRGARGLIVMVANPVDVLTQIMTETTGLPPARVIGTGTMLETARLRQMLGESLGIEPRSVHANVIGEHGDSNVVLWSGARLGGVALRSWRGWERERESEVAERVRRAAYEIIQRKGATNHAIGLVTSALLRWSLRGGRRILTVSRVQEGTCGLQGVALSLPCVVGPEGATSVIEPEMDAVEREALQRSAQTLLDARAELDARTDAAP